MEARREFQVIDATIWNVQQPEDRLTLLILATLWKLLITLSIQDTWPKLFGIWSIWPNQYVGLCGHIVSLNRYIDFMVIWFVSLNRNSGFPGWKSYCKEHVYW